MSCEDIGTDHSDVPAPRKVVMFKTSVNPSSFTLLMFVSKQWITFHMSHRDIKLDTGLWPFVSVRVCVCVCVFFGCFFQKRCKNWSGVLESFSTPRGCKLYRNNWSSSSWTKWSSWVPISKRIKTFSLPCTFCKSLTESPAAINSTEVLEGVGSTSDSSTSGSTRAAPLGVFKLRKSMDNKLTSHWLTCNITSDMSILKCSSSLD